MHNVASWPCCRSRRRSNSSAIRGKADSQATTQIRRKCPELTKSSNCQMHDVPSSTRTPPVDNTDWLKTVAIIAVAIGHFGHFFMENDHWWAVFGRVAAPAFFFLQGYAESRTIPLNWIWSSSMQKWPKWPIATAMIAAVFSQSVLSTGGVLVELGTSCIWQLLDLVSSGHFRRI